MQASCLLLEVICYRKDALMALQSLLLLSRWGVQPATSMRLYTMLRPDREANCAIRCHSSDCCIGTN
ncbi:hypothetical protein CY34DRAFT_749474 [Suillus luteus UH-Slu-Lm8-n1]|uniref:Uncharacterized protein n=1 Tax=Suillus luteus UH-Slu-Lm8-n1 TaxID=930992 RepID=A0A0C9ZYV9_9AGAM|nr:hypothetical protein CY34DRAFT_749474 [Suillus luteus UH-Slu-Lm8-n1]